jgi:DNA primase
MNDVFEQIKDKLSIVDVIEEYTPVIKRGNSTVCVCPFHKEKTPSMYISEEKGVYHCFGCLASGNIFTFVSNIENLTKKQALEKLAIKAGVDLENTEKNKTDPLIEKGFSLIEFTTKLYENSLKQCMQSDNFVKKYINKRYITTKSLDNFRLGYAPAGNFLVKIFKEQNISFELAKKTGLIVANLNNEGFEIGYRDKFSNRLIIPILNEKGIVVGFTGRTFPEDTNKDRPKYLNSGESEFFKKSNILFGLNQAKNSIYKNGNILLVEGNMDVVLAHQNGLTQCIATQGTSVTQAHINNLKKLKMPVYLAFDNDQAGIIAEKKAFKLIAEAGIDCFKVIFEGKYKDLDEFLIENQKEDLKTVPYIEYLIASEQDLTSLDVYKQKNAILKIITYIENVPKILKEQVINNLSSRTGLSNLTILSLTTNKDFNDEIESAKKTIISDKMPNIVQNFTALLSLYKISEIDEDKLKKVFDLIYKILQDTFPDKFMEKSLDKFSNGSDISGFIDIFKKQILDNKFVIDTDINTLFLMNGSHLDNFISKNFKVMYSSLSPKSKEDLNILSKIIDELKFSNIKK